MDLIGQGVLLEIDGNQKLTDAQTTPVTTIPLSPIGLSGKKQYNQGSLGRSINITE